MSSLSLPSRRLTALVEGPAAASLASCDRNVDRARAELPTRIITTMFFLIERL
jgi:hypothetical protein